MQLFLIIIVLGLAIHQFWLGHKKDQAGETKIGKLHMLASIFFIVVGLLILNAGNPS